MSVKETLSAVKQMSLLAGEKLTLDKLSVLKFAFDTDLLKISASTAGVGSGEVEVELDYKNTPIEINFNPILIREVLQNIDDEWAKLDILNNRSPAIISPENDKNYLCVIMPMSI
jgi:DNA polymerase-3 subunit beta